MAISTPADLDRLMKHQENVVFQGSINQAGLDAFQAGRIPGAILFDVNECSERNSPYPFTLPTKEQFEEYIQKLGVRKTAHIVVYDATPCPIKASARIWWMFRLFGHDNVTILTGGFDFWKECGYDEETCEPRKETTMADKLFVSSYRPHISKDMDDIVNNLNEKAFQHVDARPQSLFDAGFIRGSINIPFDGVVDEKGRVKPREDLEKLFTEAGINLQEPMVASCRTGVTACILALAAFICGNHDVAIYDGSFNEWKANQ